MSTQQRWEFLLRYAVRAPSSHNSQPWRFRVAEDGRLHVHADRSRALPVVDPAGRELVMSCGAAVAHLRVALRHLGHAGDVVPFPDPLAPDLLATVGFGPPHVPSVADDLLFEAIGTRSTHRGPFEGRDLPSPTLTELVGEAERFGATVAVLTGDDQVRVAALVGEGDQIQFGDSRFRRELAAWIRPNHTRRLDGIRGAALGLGGLASLLAPTIVATFDTGASQAKKDEQLALRAPALLVVSSPGDTPSDWLSAGQAVAMLLLRATCQGLAASFLNQPIETPALRDRLRALVGGDDYPQLLLRVGYAPADLDSLRRPVSDVLAGRG